MRTTLRDPDRSDVTIHPHSVDPLNTLRLLEPALRGGRGCPNLAPQSGSSNPAPVVVGVPIRLRVVVGVPIRLHQSGSRVVVGVPIRLPRGGGCPNPAPIRLPNPAAL